MDNKLQLIQEEVARINQISEYDNSVGSTKTLGNDLSKIVIHYTKQESKKMLTESVSDTKDTDFNLNNVFATMDGKNLIVDGHILDLETQESKGHIFDNHFLTYLEIAESQRDTLYREGLYEASLELNDTILRISDRLRKHGEIILEDGQPLMEQWYRLDKHAKSLYDYGKKKFKQGKKKFKQGVKHIKKKAGEYWDRGTKFLSDKWKTLKKYVGDGYDWIKDKANAAWKWTKKNVLALLAKGFIWVAQALEAALFSVAGIVVDVVLGFTGYGAIPMLVLWGIVAVYRIYIWQKEGGWINFLMIVCCMMGMLPGGAVIAKVLRGGASVLKGVTSTAKAASKLNKFFKPSTVNWIGKVLIDIKNLLGKVFYALNWFIGKIPGLSGISKRMGNFGGKISSKLDKLFTALGRPLVTSSTTLAAGGIGILSYEFYKAVTDGMNLEDIKDTEIALYDDYVPNDTGYEGVGPMITKVSELKNDYETTADGKAPMILKWVAKKGSPAIKLLKKHPFFDGYSLIEEEPYGADPQQWALNTCSKKYGCPNGYEMKNGKAVASAAEDVVFSQEEIDDYEREANAYVEELAAQGKYN